MKFAKWLAAGALALTSATALGQSAVGDWNGRLQAGGTVLRIAVHVGEGPEGALVGTMDSLDQGAIGIPLANISASDGKLAFDVPAVGGHYEAVWNAGAAVWDGTWSQGGGQLPLDLTSGPPSAPEALPANWQVPSNAELIEAIDERIAPRADEGIVIGVVGQGGQRVVADGPAGAATFDGDTVFEIGSISKVFTALILSDMVLKGEVSLDDPVQKFLPEGAAMPSGGGRAITLRDLSLHQSGLPRLPDNMPFGDPDDPYADYTGQMLLDFLSGYELPRDVGAQWDYSNLGVGLLGYVLTRASGEDYETLLRERITGPLDMADTSVSLSPDQQARFAPGYDAFMRPAKPWHLPALVGAGGIRSTTGDMLKFAAGMLDPGSPLAGAMQLTLAQRRPGPDAKTQQALGWQVHQPEPGREIVLHNGGTGGFRSALVLEPARNTAVVVLANSAAEPSATDLAMHALIGSPVAPTPPLPPAPPPPVARTAIELPVAELDRMAGRYDFGQGIVFEVTRDGNVLKAKRADVPGAPSLPIYPEAPLKFFWKAADSQIVFTTDDGGAVTGAEFTGGGQTLTGRKIGT